MVLVTHSGERKNFTVLSTCKNGMLLSCSPWGVTRNKKMSIMADIYGSQNAVLFQTGLVDADDEEDFDIKFQSLESV